MMTDDVLQEVRAAREAFAKLHGYDIRATVAALRQLNAVGDWKVVRLPARTSANTVRLVDPVKHGLSTKSLPMT